MLQRLLLDPADRKTLYALVEDDVYRSTDGAETWVPLRSGASRFRSPSPRIPLILVRCSWIG